MDEKPGTAAPTQQLVQLAQIHRLHVNSGRVAFLPQASPPVIRGQKTALFYPKAEVGRTTHIRKASLRCHMNRDHKGLKTGH